MATRGGWRHCTRVLKIGDSHSRGNRGSRGGWTRGAPGLGNFGWEGIVVDLEGRLAGMVGTGTKGNGGR